MTGANVLLEAMTAFLKCFEVFGFWISMGLLNQVILRFVFFKSVDQSSCSLGRGKWPIPAFISDLLFGGLSSQHDHIWGVFGMENFGRP